MKKKGLKHDLINIGSGYEFKIKDYVNFIIKIIDKKNKLKIIYDKKKPNGTFKKLLDSSLAKKSGWSHKINFEKGISIVINDYLKNHLNNNF